MLFLQNNFVIKGQTRRLHHMPDWICYDCTCNTITPCECPQSLALYNPETSGRYLIISFLNWIRKCRPIRSRCLESVCAIGNYSISWTLEISRSVPSKYTHSGRPITPPPPHTPHPLTPHPTPHIPTPYPTPSAGEISFLFGNFVVWHMSKTEQWMLTHD